mgnify:CR=1 FL=1
MIELQADLQTGRYEPGPYVSFYIHDVRNFTRRVRLRWSQFCKDQITFAEFDASVQGWINQVRYADTWGLRGHVLGKPLIRDSAPGQPETSTKPES